MFSTLNLLPRSLSPSLENISFSRFPEWDPPYLYPRSLSLTNLYLSRYLQQAGQRDGQVLAGGSRGKYLHLPGRSHICLLACWPFTVGEPVITDTEGAYMFGIEVAA